MPELKVGPHMTIFVSIEPKDIGYPLCGQIVEGISQDEKHSNRRFSAMVDAIESLVLAHACAGINVEDDRYIQGVGTAIDACLNNNGE